MDIRDLSLLDRASNWLDELLVFSKKSGKASARCPNLTKMVHRNASALLDSIRRLREALDEAGPPPMLQREKPPLYLRISEMPELGEIASFVTHHGCHEDDFHTLTRELAHKYGGQRVSEAMMELTWLDREQRWVKLRPETLRSLRPYIGPLPSDPDWQRWWTGQGKTPPEPRSPGHPRPQKKPKAEVTGSDEDLARAVQEARAKKTPQSLKAMLTRARNDLATAGAEWIVRSAKARIRAAEEEMHRRNLEIPQ